MARRYGAPYNGKRYIGNNSTHIKNREVHDLDNEDTSFNFIYYFFHNFSAPIVSVKY